MRHILTNWIIKHQYNFKYSGNLNACTQHYNSILIQKHNIFFYGSNTNVSFYQHASVLDYFTITKTKVVKKQKQKVMDYKKLFAGKSNLAENNRSTATGDHQQLSYHSNCWNFNETEKVYYTYCTVSLTLTTATPGASDSVTFNSSYYLGQYATLPSF